MAGFVTTKVDLDQLPQGSVVSTTSQAGNTENEYAATAVELGNGVNSIAVPSWAVGVIIRPDPTNTVALTLKGAAGDTGTPLAPGKVSGPIMFPAAPPASILIVAAANTTTTTIVEFI